MQLNTTRLHQVALPLGEPVSPAVVQSLSSLLAAVNLCIQAAGREPKAAYIELGIEKSHWSRIQGGTVHFPADKLLDLMDAMGNDIPLQWLAFRRGKGLHLLESEQQRIMRQKDERIAEIESENRLMRELLQGAR